MVEEVVKPAAGQNQKESSGEDWREGGFSLYVHWPFCASKCPYCDFNSHVAGGVDQPRWLTAYQSEIARLAREVPGRVLNSIFFGGGTPSLMAPETVGGVLNAARAGWSFANDIEITLEANPTSAEAERFHGYAAVGVNRVSLGVQALNDPDLRRLGRLHSAAEARAAFELARGIFPRVSFDLIYARQDQEREAWRRELREALAMAADHLSLYQLTIEPGTAFGTRHAAGGLHGLPGEELSADLYEETQDLCEAAGLPAYEVSNHARPGAESRHNLCYWRQGDWAAVGPGAHGRVTVGPERFATEALTTPQEWLERVERDGCGDFRRVAILAEEQVAELLLMGLRVTEGVSLKRLERLGYDAASRAASLAELGVADLCEGRLRATASGRMLLNEILRTLMA